MNRDNNKGRKIMDSKTGNNGWKAGGDREREREREKGREHDAAEPALFPGDGFVYSLVLTHGTWESPYADSHKHHTAFHIHAFRNHTNKQSLDSRQLSQAAA